MAAANVAGHGGGVGECARILGPGPQKHRAVLYVCVHALVCGGSDGGNNARCARTSGRGRAAYNNENSG